MNRNILIFLGCFFMLVSCKNVSEKEGESQLAESNNSKTESALQKFIAGLDSVNGIEFRQVVDYKKPDSDIISRLTSTDTLNQIKSWIAVTDTVSMNCTEYDGKMYLLNKSSEVIKTVYYSVADSCSYLGYNLNGRNYYIAMNQEMKEYFQLLEEK